jgi:transcriptional regulator with XRE-family HTH domain
MSNVTHLPEGYANDGNEVVVKNVRAEMSYAGIKNQTELAKSLGVSQMWVSRRLSGGTPITADEIVMLADFFGVEPGQLFVRRERRGSGPAAGVRSFVLIDGAPEAPASWVKTGCFDVEDVDDARPLAPVVPIRKAI